MKNAVVFGATSTIASKVIELLASNGFNLILLARNLECLEVEAQNLKIKNPNIKVNTLYYNAEEDINIENIMNKIKQEYNTVDLLLIAHGNLPDQKLCQTNWQEEYNSLKINGLSVLQICHYFANFMVEQKYGIIAVISSVAALRGRQSNYTYGVAKGMINTYLSGLRNRLFKHNVHVLTIMPGFVDTKMTKGFAKGLLWATSEKVAKDIVKSIGNKKNIIYTPFFWQYIMMIICHIPERIFKKLKL